METRTLPNREFNQTQVMNGRSLIIARLVWVIVVFSALLYFFSSLPEGFRVYSQSSRWALGYADVLAQLQISPNVFAGFLIFLEVLVLLPSAIYSALVLIRRSDDWLVLLVTATIFLLPLTSSFSVYQNGSSFGGLLFGFATFSIFATLMLFPDGAFVPKSGRYILFLSIPIFLVSGFYFAGLMRGQALTGVEAIVILTGQTIAFFFGIGSQIYRYRRVASPLQRQQTKWLIMGMLLFLSMIIVFIILQFFPALRVPSINPDAVIYEIPSLVMVFIFVPLLQFGITLIPISIGLAVIRYRLWDIDFVLNRSLVYAVQLILLLLLFGTIFFILQVILGAAFGSTQDSLAIGISAAVVAAAFNPVRVRTRHFIDRNLFGLRFDLNELQAVEKRQDHKIAGSLTGVILEGYEVLDLIGKGGMGEVYKAQGEGKVVAIKTMLKEIAQKEDMRRRFWNEAAAGRRLDHPNIAKVLGGGDYDGTPYLVLDFIEGRDLKQILTDEGRMDEESLLSILSQICDALDHSHSLGFVHRDIKPANLMLQSNGKAILMDFGVTKITNSDASLTGTGAIGTIDYMSPEQIRASKGIDGRADIYALGIVCYEMLIGTKPFQGSAAQIVFAHLQQPPPDPREEVEVSRALAKAIMQAMAKEPEARFATAKGFLQAAMGG